MEKKECKSFSEFISTDFISLLIGGALGASISSLYFYSINSSDIAAGTVANIIIAMCTFIALVISYFSIKSQKDNRRWEINKDLLIRLATSLSDQMDQTAESRDIEFDNEARIPNNKNTAWDPEVSKKFNQSLSHTVQVYEVLLNKEIIDAVETYKKEESDISNAAEIDAISLFEAYDSSFAAQRNLMQVLQKNIKAYAAI